MQPPALCTEDVLLSLRRPIAVVGNGLPDRPMGSLIDRYATVIRLNNFEIAGHEPMVGQRTSLRVKRLRRFTRTWRGVSPSRAAVSMVGAGKRPL